MSATGDRGPSAGPALRAAGVVLAVGWMVPVLALTLVPADTPDPGAFQWCLLCGERGTADAIANVLLLLPLAAGLVWSGVSPVRTVVVGFLLSATLEFVQLRLVPGRDSTLGDVTWNTLGAALGVAVAWWLPSRRRGGVRALAAAAAAVVVIAAGGVLLRPRFPATPYVGRVQEDLRLYAWYSGRIVSADVGGIKLPAGPIAASPQVRRRLADGDTLSVLTYAGGPGPHASPIFSVFDTARSEIVFVGNDHGDLALRVSTLATDLRLDRPDLRWRGAMRAISPGDRLVLQVWRAHGGYCVRLNGRERCGLAPTAGRLWALLQSAPHFPPAALAALDGLFLLLLGLPIGLVLRRAAAGYAAVALALAGVWVVPPLVGLAPTPLAQVVALVAGILVGMLLPPREGPRAAPAAGAPA